MTYFRFYRRIPIIPGWLYLNISKSGFSFSLGRRGLTTTVGKKGVRLTAGLPGTGMSVSKNVSYDNFKGNDNKNYNTDLSEFIGGNHGEKKEK